MDALFRRATLSSVSIALAGAGLFLFSLALSVQLQLPVAARFLPVLESSIFLAALVVQQVRMAMGSYLRAHKQEPLAALSVVEGLLAVPVLTILGRELGALGMILGFTGLTLASLVPAVHIFRTCRARWHVPSLAGASQAAVKIHPQPARAERARPGGSGAPQARAAGIRPSSPSEERGERAERRARRAIQT
jgi:hypothetical protein